MTPVRKSKPSEQTRLLKTISTDLAAIRGVLQHWHTAALCRESDRQAFREVCIYIIVPATTVAAIVCVGWWLLV